MTALYGKPLRSRDIFKDFQGRRAGILKALTDDADKFFEQCDPEIDKDLCLYGYPDGNWEVRVPPLDFPSDYLPEPTLGINFERPAGKTYWLSFVAYHSDSWLLSVAFFHAGASELGKKSRNKLFNMINNLPTVHEIVTEKRTSRSRRANKFNPEPVNETVVSHGHGQDRPRKRKKEEESNEDWHLKCGK